MQSKKMSLIESIANVVIGYLVALAAQIVVFPLLDIPVSLEQNLLIGLIFTVVSLGRSYCVRRVFNRMLKGKEGKARVEAWIVRQ